MNEKFCEGVTGGAATRSWTALDVEKIAALEQVCFSDPWSEEAIRSSFESPLYKGVLIEDGGGILAYGLVSVLFEDAEIAIVAVAPSERRRGLGKAVLGALTDLAERGGAQRIFLEVRISNIAARRLYEGAGFLPLNVRKKYYADGEDALVMVKEICL